MMDMKPKSQYFSFRRRATATTKERKLKLQMIANTIQTVVSVSNQIDQRQDETVRREEDEELYRICREAAEACLRSIIEHLYDFVEDCFNTNAHYYEDWIKELHPENVDGGKVDHRFYIKESEHRIIWNDLMEKRQKTSLIIHPRQRQLMSQSQ